MPDQKAKTATIPEAAKPKKRPIRGADFYGRYLQGAWSEERALEAVNAMPGFFALPYGCSGAGPTDPEATNAYLERLSLAGNDAVKRPDLLVFKREDPKYVSRLVSSIGGAKELPFIQENHRVVVAILSRAIGAVECENSMWNVEKLEGARLPLERCRREPLPGDEGQRKIWGVKTKLTSKTPHLIIKEEDIARLTSWENSHKIPIHIWQAFYDKSYGISFRKFKRLIAAGWIDPKEQEYENGRKAKTTFCCPTQFGYSLALSAEFPETKSVILEIGAKISVVGYFVGGRWETAEPMTKRLRRLALVRSTTRSNPLLKTPKVVQPASRRP